MMNLNLRLLRAELPRPVAPLPRLRIAVPAWGAGAGSGRAGRKADAVSREEIVALFGDFFAGGKRPELTPRERAEMAMNARLRDAIYT